MNFKEIIRFVLSWRLLLILFSLPAIFFLSPRVRFVNLNSQPSFGNFFSMWSNFEGVDFLKIAQFGYGYQHKNILDYAISPLFPLLLRSLNFWGNYLYSGLVFSHLCLILALYFLLKLMALDLKSSTTKLVVLLILSYPSAFFLGALYPESLFLLLVVLSFYLARQRSFPLAFCFATLATLTQITGFFLWPALVYEYWLFNHRSVKNCLKLPTLWLLLSPMTLFGFLRFQYLNVGGNLFPTVLQKSLFGVVVDKLVLPHQVYFRYLKMLIFTDHMDPLFFTILLELFSATLIITILVLTIRKMRFSYWLFCFLSFLLPIFSGTFMSLPRYILALFPIFMMLALWLERQHPFVKYLYYLICFFGTVLSVIYFTRGYFIA